MPARALQQVVPKSARTPELGEQIMQVRKLAQAYEERPVTLIRMIYALRDSTIQSFADAFKFRKR